MDKRSISSTANAILFYCFDDHGPSDDTVRRIWAKTFTKSQNMRLGSQEENKISDASEK